MHFFSDDRAIVGTPFYVMADAGPVFCLPPCPKCRGSAPRYLYRLMDALAKLHKADYRAVGLADYGKPGSYFAVRSRADQAVGRLADDCRVNPSIDKLVAG